MNWNDLEDEIIDAIQRCCQTEEDGVKAKEYFENCLINDIIDEALN